MTRPIQATIHIGALRHNLRRCRLAAPQAKLWAVVKANAYGHGIERVYEGLRDADGFALLDVSEADRVRRLGWRGPVLLLEGVFDAVDLDACSRLNVWHTVHCDEQIEMLAAHRTRTRHTVFLKMNSGMNRLGFAPDRYRAAWARLVALPQVDEVVHMTHFSDADGGGIADQLGVFTRVTRDLPGARSLPNSAALLRDGGAGDSNDASAMVWTDGWARPGICLYGGSPDYPQHTRLDWDLRPAMTLTARIIATQSVEAGECVGYGSRCVVDRPSRVGVVACGYADGYPFTCSPGTPVLVDGVRSQVLGRVSMDMLAVDLTDRDGGVGTNVTLWGCAANGVVLDIDEVARSAQTIGYDLMCALALRVPVVVRD